jgi:hypothetical protein
MSDKKISQLELVESNASGDQFPLVQNGGTMKTTLSKIVTYLDSFFTTTAEVAAQITAAIAGKEDTANKQNNLNTDATNTKYPTVTATNAGLATKLNLSGGNMTGAIAMGTSKITGLGNPTLAQDAATKFYVDGLTTDFQLEYDLSNTATGTTLVNIDALSGVATFTQRLNAKSNAYYAIDNAEIDLRDKIECHLYYEGAGFPVIMHYSTVVGRIKIHVGNIAVDGGSGTNTNADLVVTFRKI